MMQKNEYRRNENKRSFRTERKPGKSRNTNSMCPVSRRCGGCQFLDIPYEKQLQHKQKQVEDLLKGICPVKKITGMDNPFSRCIWISEGESDFRRL